jgi:hypothetical protein
MMDVTLENYNINEKKKKKYEKCKVMERRK